MSIIRGFELLSKYEFEVLCPLLPNIMNTSEGFSNFGTYQFDFFGDNLLFVNSKFEVQNIVENKFIHFTRADSCINILRSNEIWVSKLASLSDKNEFLFANKYFSDNLNSNGNLKNKIFSFSACLYSSETISNDRMWIDYADNHMGVSIIFKLNPLYFERNLKMGKIQYKNDPIDDLIELNIRHNKFVHKYNISYGSFSESLYFISSFYKLKSRFENENEVRILKYFEDHEDIPSQFFKISINNKFKPENYFEIEDILFGKDIDQNKKYEISKLMNV